MATDLVAPGAEEPDRDRGPSRPERSESGGFFTIYKKGQGYWTRVCTAIGAAVLIGLTAQFFYSRIPDYFPTIAQHRNIFLLVIAALMGVSMAVIWRLMNKPVNADFLIATDSEMKKVNWTSRRELFGSTKVVILFMFLIAALLFVLDLYFTRMFFLLGVLVTDPPLWTWVEARFGLAAKMALDVATSVVVFGGAAWAVVSASRSK